MDKIAVSNASFSGSCKSRLDSEPRPSTSYDSRPESLPHGISGFVHEPIDPEPQPENQRLRMNQAGLEVGPSTSYDLRPDRFPSLSLSKGQRPNVIPEFDNDLIAPEPQSENQRSVPNQDEPEILSAHSQESEHSALEGWTKDDKFHLMKVLKRNGTHDIDSIKKSLPLKSAEDITAAMEYYKKITKDRLKTNQSDPIKIRKSTPRFPLTSWAQFLTDRLEYDQLCTDTPNALRLIAECEDIPPATDTGNIDFRRIYHTLANAMEGKPIENDDVTAMLLDECVSECCMLSARFMEKSQLQNIVDNIDVHESTTANFCQTDDAELIAVRHLTAQRNYNPLNIKIDDLKIHNEKSN